MRLEGQFDYDRLEAYALARMAVRELESVLVEVPRGFAELVTQIRRASLSVMLNIAEGSGEFAPMEKARFYRIARRSADECCSALDYLADTGVITDDSIHPPRLLYWRTVSALVKLIRSMEQRLPARTPAPAPPRTRTRARAPDSAPPPARPSNDPSPSR